MNIIQTLDRVVTDALQEQKVRTDSIKFKQTEIAKHKNFAKKEEERILEIQKEYNEASLQIAEIIKIKKQLQEVVEPIKV